MGIEIERKFLVNKEQWKLTNKGAGTLYRQGYLLTEPGKIIRIRLSGGKGFITIKGTMEGISRPEFEYLIPETDAEELLEKFCASVVTKTRFRIIYAAKLWEVDEFAGENEGLIVAEIELASEQETFDLPPWLAEEVTRDERYYNSSLSKYPYLHWATE